MLEPIFELSDEDWQFLRTATDGEEVYTGETGLGKITCLIVQYSPDGLWTYVSPVENGPFTCDPYKFAGRVSPEDVKAECLAEMATWRD